MPGGISPSTTLNRTGLAEVAHSVVVTKNVWRSPTLKVAGSLGVMEQSDGTGLAASALAGKTSTAATAADRKILRNLGLLMIRCSPPVSCSTTHPSAEIAV